MASIVYAAGSCLISCTGASFKHTPPATKTVPEAWGEEFDNQSDLEFSLLPEENPWKKTKFTT